MSSAHIDVLWSRPSVTLAEAREMTGYSRTGLLRLAHDGHILIFREGPKTIRIVTDSLKKYFERRAKFR